MILQAVCRWRVRKCDGSRCPPSSVYIIASRGSRIADDLPNIFPGCRVVVWEPVEARLTGKVGGAVVFILERTKDANFVSDAEVMEQLGMKDRANLRRCIKKHEDFIRALDECGVSPCQRGRRAGFQLRVATLFGEVVEA
jgi:hypothetical protein